MPYCAKCGVEVNPGTIRCPLCAFAIPRIEDEPGESENMFPVAENIYYHQLLEAKKQMFLGLSILCLGAVITLASVHMFAGVDGKYMQYGIAGVLGAWFYMFFLFGFVTNIYLSVAGVGSLSLIMLLALDLIDGRMTWAADVGFPVTGLVTGILLLAIKLYKRFRRKNQFVIIPIYMFTGASVFCLGLELILDYHFTRTINPGWSLIVLGPLLSLAGGLGILYVKLPEYGREKVRRKLHL